MEDSEARVLVEYFLFRSIPLSFCNMDICSSSHVGKSFHNVLDANQSVSGVGCRHASCPGEVSLDVSITCGYGLKYPDTLYLDMQRSYLSVSGQPQAPLPLEWNQSA